ncbi:hypothetical protein Tco_1372758, partial [Tanacetum coccineum]
PIGGLSGDVGLNSFRKAIGTNHLSHPNDYAKLPLIEIVKEWFPYIRYNGTVEATRTLKKSFLPPRRRKKPTSSKKHPLSKIEAAKSGSSSKETTGSKTGLWVKETQSSSTLDINPCQPPASTHVVARMHKEDQQATGGPTSLGVTSEGGVNPQLSSAEVDLGKSAPNDSISKQQGMDKGTQNYSIDHIIIGTDPHVLASHAEMEVRFSSDEFNTSPDLISFDEVSKIIKLEDLLKLVHDVKTDFMELESLEDEPIIVEDDTEEEDEADKTKEIHATSNTETEDTSSQKHKLENKKRKVEAKIALLITQPHFLISLPSELKKIPSKFFKLTGEVKWELPAEFLSVPTQIKSIQDKIETLDALPSLLNKVIEALNKFAQVIKSTLKKAGDHCVPSAGQANIKPVEGDKNTQQVTISQDTEEEDTKSDSDDNTINMAGSMVDSSNKKKLRSLILSLKVYREDGTDEVIPNFKDRDLHLAKLGIDLDKPLSEQDLLDKLNEMAKKKRKIANDIYDFFKSTKRLKSSVKYKDHPFGTVLNEPVLGVILFKSFQRLHQGPGLDDHVRTFSSFLLAEVDKKNLNPLKQMKVIEQLRQYMF